MLFRIIAIILCLIIVVIFVRYKHFAVKDNNTEFHIDSMNYCSFLFGAMANLCINVQEYYSDMPSVVKILFDILIITIVVSYTMKMEWKYKKIIKHYKDTEASGRISEGKANIKKEVSGE